MVLLNKPSVNGDRGTWGPKILTALDTLNAAKAELDTDGDVIDGSGAKVLGGVDAGTIAATYLAQADATATYATLAGTAATYAPIAAPPTIDTDYATLELALAATPVGGVLEVLGTWSRTTVFTVNKTCTLRGAGGSITATSTNHGVAVTAAGVTLDGLALTGTGAATSGAARAVTATGTVGAPVTGLTVTGCTITGWSQYGVHAQHVTDFTITANTISTIAYAGIMVLSGIRGRITGNRVATITMPSPLTLAYGIAMTRATSASLAVHPQSSDIECSRNTVTGVTGWEGIDTHAGRRLTITENRVIGCYRGIVIAPGDDDAAVESYAAQEITVAGNIIDAQVSDGSRGEGIAFVGAGVTVGAPVEYATGVVANNIIIDHGTQLTHSASSACGMYIESTHGLVVSGNRIVRGGVCGVQVFHSNKALSLSDNVIEDAWTTDAAFAVAVHVRSTHNTATISGTRLARGAKTATLVHSTGLRVQVDANSAIIDGGGNSWSDATTAITNGATVVKSSAYGIAPVVRAAAVASPAADTAALKTAVDAIRVALTAYGITL